MTAGYAQGQQAAMSVMLQRHTDNMQAATWNATVHKAAGKTGSKTTAGPGGMRWLNYALYMEDTLGPGNYGFGAPFMWWSDSAWTQYPSMPGRIEFGSVGDILEPTVAAFNDSVLFPHVIAISPVDSYSIDSISIAGMYMRNYGTPAKIAVVDTLRFRLVYGNGTITSNILDYYSVDVAFIGEYGLPAFHDTINYWVMAHDSLTNVACNAPGVTGGISPTFDLLLTSADSSSNYSANVALPTPFAVPPGMSVAMSVTFKSGDPGAYPAGTFHDTVYNAAHQYVYNAFRPFFLYRTVGGSPAYPFYTGYPDTTPADRNGGNVRFVPCPGDPVYASMYGMVSGTSASVIQYPLLGFHATCSTCYTTSFPVFLNVNKTAVLQNIVVVPNPANDELSISFEGSNNTAMITLTDMRGSVVAVQEVTNGKAEFDITDMPGGVYLYTIYSSGERSTGRVVIMH